MNPDSQRDAHWATRFGELAAFVNEHGRWPQARPSEELLRNWQTTQRYKSSVGELEPGRRALLDLLGTWEAEPFEVRFARRVEEARAFVAEHNRTPRRHADGREGVLARWLVSLQRRPLTAEQEHALVAAGVWPMPAKDNWDERFDELAAFIKTHDRFPTIRKSTGKAERSIYYWLARQRTQARDLDLHPDREAKLSELGEWAPGDDGGIWSTWLAAAAQFVLDHDREPSPDADDRTESYLGQWLAMQRDAAARGRLSERRHTCLLSEGLVADPAGDVPEWLTGGDRESYPFELV